MENYVITNEILEKAANGDLDSVKKLYAYSYSAIYKTVKFISSDENIVMDIIQNAYVKAITNLGMLNNPDAFGPWVKKIAITDGVEIMKKHKPNFLSGTGDVSFVGTAKNTDNLLDILSCLSSESRYVLALSALEKFPQEAISEILRIPSEKIPELISVAENELIFALKNTDKAVEKFNKLTDEYITSTPRLPFIESTFETIRFGLGLDFFKKEENVPVEKTDKPNSQMSNIEEEIGLKKIKPEREPVRRKQKKSNSGLLILLIVLLLIIAASLIAIWKFGFLDKLIGKAEEAEEAYVNSQLEHDSDYYDDDEIIEITPVPADDAEEKTETEEASVKEGTPEKTESEAEVSEAEATAEPQPTEEPEEEPTEAPTEAPTEEPEESEAETPVVVEDAADPYSIFEANYHNDYTGYEFYIEPTSSETYWVTWFAEGEIPASYEGVITGSQIIIKTDDIEGGKITITPFSQYLYVETNDTYESNATYSLGGTYYVVN